MPASEPLVVTMEGTAGMVRESVPDLLESATEVAVMVTVTGDVEAGGAVKVAEEVVVFESAPPPLTLQVTPSEFLSLVMLAVKVMESAPSTEATDAVTVTLTGAEPLTQPDRVKTARKDKTMSANLLANMRGLN